MTSNTREPNAALQRAAAESDPAVAAAILSSALSAARAAHDAALCCRLLSALGDLRRSAEDLHGALSLYLEARQQGLRGGSDAETMTFVESSITFNLVLLGLADQAVEYAERAYEFALRLPPCVTRTRAFNALALTQTRVGHFDQADATYRLTIRDARASNAPIELWRAYLNRGVAASNRAALPELAGTAAARLLRRQLRLNAVAKGLGRNVQLDPVRATLPLANDIDALTRLGRLDEAEAALGEFEGRIASAADAAEFRERCEAMACAQKAMIELKRERFASAEALLTRSIAAHEAIGDKQGLPDLLGYLSEAQEAQGDFRGALHSARWSSRLQLDMARAVSAARLQMLEVTQGLDQARATIELERRRSRAIDLQRQALQVEAERLVQASHTDSLTGLGNRRLLADVAAAMAATNGEPVGVGVIDLDHFKQVNDSFGHALGDTVLATVARVIERTCRPGDNIFRLGGEEFAVLLRRASAPAAAVVFERLCSAVRAHPWHDIHPTLRVTISIGAAHALTPFAVDDLLAIADARLYDAKRSGRDRVCVAPPCGDREALHPAHLRR